MCSFSACPGEPERTTGQTPHRPRPWLRRGKHPVLCGILMPDPGRPPTCSDHDRRASGEGDSLLPSLTPLALPHPDSQLTHTHPALGVLGAKGELFLRCEEAKRAPRQMEGTSRPQLHSKGCSGRPKPWGSGGWRERRPGVSLEGVAHPSCPGSTHTSFRSKVWTLWPWKERGHRCHQGPDHMLPQTISSES